MVALIFLLLNLIASIFKPKSKLTAEPGRIASIADEAGQQSVKVREDWYYPRARVRSLSSAGAVMTKQMNGSAKNTVS
jgi:signal recognition particle subunit SEC65